MFLRLVLVSCATALMMCSACFAQRAGQGAGPALLVLKNSGRVVYGKIHARAGGYDVQKPAGRMFIPNESVWLEAKDLDDAYLRVRESYKELTPETHINIAQWCLANHQLGSARKELLDALHMQPHHSEAMRMLKRLEVLARPKAEKKPKRSVTQLRLDNLMQGERESLGGLSADQARLFVTRVMPIVEQRCGNSGCHGSKTKTDFRITRTRGRGHRTTSERNLAAVLKHVDLKRASDSVLLKAITRPHADGRAVLSGRGGRVQREILTKWIMSVGGDKQAVEPADAIAASQPNEVKQTAMQTESDAEPSPVRNSILKKAQNAALGDAFDPAEFNLRYHGITTQEKTSRGGAASETQPARQK